MGDNNAEWTKHYLSLQDWETISKALYDVSYVCNRIRLWSPMEYIGNLDSDQTGRIRWSQVCFRDAANFVHNANYALYQSIKTRKAFTRSELKIEDLVLSDIESRLYADYVPLLLYSATEHACKGLESLLNLRLEKGKYKLEKVYNALTNYHSQEAITQATQIFMDSPIRDDMSNYRNDWVHNKPRRIESLVYNPPRAKFVEEADKFLVHGAVWFGVESSIDFTWQTLITSLQTTLDLTATFLNVCADTWESKRVEWGF